MQKATEEEVLIGDSYAVFNMSIKSQETLKKYKPRLRNVLKSIGLNTEQCVELGLKQPGLNQPSELQARLQKFILSKVEKYRKTGRPKPGTIRGYLKPMQRFCKMNDISNINWPKLKSFLPAETPSDDRAIRKEEIQELYKHADLRERVILTVRASSGMRIGSLPYLQFKHIQPITLEDLKRMRIDYEPQIAYGDIVAAKVTAYDTKGRKWYTTYISPEAYRDIDEYKKYRERYCEKVTDDSPLIRDKFDKREIAGKGVPITKDAIRHIMQDLLYRAGLRKKDEHKVRHEFQATHSSRKFFRTMAWQVVGADTANLLMGHSLGIDDSYLKPEHELLTEYLKVVPLVTINQEIQDNKQSEKIDKLEKHKDELVERIIKLEEDRKKDHEAVEGLMKERWNTEQAIQAFIKKGVSVELGSYDEEWKDDRERLGCAFNPPITKCKDTRWLNLPKPVQEFILSMIPSFNDDRILYGYVAVKDRNGKEICRVHDEDLPDSF